MRRRRPQPSRVAAMMALPFGAAPSAVELDAGNRILTTLPAAARFPRSQILTLVPWSGLQMAPSLT